MVLAFYIASADVVDGAGWASLPSIRSPRLTPLGPNPNLYGITVATAWACVTTVSSQTCKKSAMTHHHHFARPATPGLRAAGNEPRAK
jgi:hypothetical protein